VVTTRPYARFAKMSACLKVRDSPMQHLRRNSPQRPEAMDGINQTALLHCI